MDKINNHILEDIGLSPKETSLYLALLRSGRAGATQLAKITQMHRTNLYDTLERLKERGLVAYLNQQGRLKFDATDPKRLLEICEEKKENIAQQMPHLRALRAAQSTDDPRVNVYTGKESLKLLLRTAIRSQKELLGINIDEKKFFDNIPYEFEHYIREIERLGIHERLLAELGTMYFTGSKNSEYRFVSKEYFGPTTILIFGKFVAMIMWEPSIVMIMIENKTVADDYRKNFELLWKIGITRNKPNAGTKIKAQAIKSSQEFTHEGGKMKDLVESFSGVRGIFGESITQDFAARYALVFAGWLRKKVKAPRVVIGMDTRRSGPAIKAAMIAAIRSLVDEIIDVGIATTPMTQLAVREYHADAGIIITASHNEPQFNGWKFLGADGAVIHADQMKEIIHLTRSKQTYVPATSTDNPAKILDKSLDIEDKYRKFILAAVGKKAIKRIKGSSIKLLVDPNGGAASKIAQKVISDLAVQAEFVAARFGEFRRTIEPTKKSLENLSRQLLQKKADFAIAFDCDADRGEFVVPIGNGSYRLMSGHYLIAIIADYMLPECSNKAIVVNDATSQIVGVIAKKHRAKLYEVEVGETNVVKEMKRRKACIGGEGSASGVIIPPSTCRDGLLGLAMLLGILAEKKVKLGEILDALPQYYTIAVNLKMDAKGLKERVRKYFDGYKITETGDETGGIKVWIDDSSWIWMRESKTEPGLVKLIADSKSPEKSDDLIVLGKAALGIGTTVC